MKSVAPVTIRRVRPSDAAALADFYAALSAESRRARFLGYTPGMSPSLSRSFCTPDHMHAEGFVASLATAAGGEQELVGHLCLEPAGGRSIELALAVADEYQGRGLGRALLEAAVNWGQKHDVQAILASAFADNVRVLRLLSSSPHGARILPARGGVVDVVIPLVAELPHDLFVMPHSAVRRRQGRLVSTVRPCCRAFWQRRPRPERDAVG